MTNRKETKRFSDSVSPGSTVTETHIVGDADHWSFDTDVPVERNDEIGVEVHNATGDLPDDQQFAYDYVVDITLDYEGGTSRFLPSFLSGVLS